MNFLQWFKSDYKSELTWSLYYLPDRNAGSGIASAYTHKGRNLIREYMHSVALRRGNRIRDPGLALPASSRVDPYIPEGG